MNKKYIVDTTEAKRILMMHKSLMKEQAQQTPAQQTPAQQTPEQIIEKFRKIGCLKDGSTYKDSSGKIYYGKKTQKGNTIKYYTDMTFTVLDPNNKVLKTANWNCDKFLADDSNQQEQIRILKLNNWKSRDDLKHVSEDDLNDTTLYQKHPKYELWRSVKDSTTPAKSTDDQKEAIARARSQGFYPKNEFLPGEIPEDKCTFTEKLFPGVFNANVQVCASEYPPKKYGSSNNQNQDAAQGQNAAQGQQNTASVEERKQEGGVFAAKGYANIEGQIKPKQDCRWLVKLYYDAWSKGFQLSNLDFQAMKNDAQMCVNQHNYSKNIFSKSDDFVRIMTGMESGKGPGQDPDKNGRVWILTAKKR